MPSRIAALAAAGSTPVAQTSVTFIDCGSNACTASASWVKLTVGPSWSALAAPDWSSQWQHIWDEPLGLARVVDKPG